MKRDAPSALAAEFCRETYGFPDGTKLAEGHPYFGWLGTAALMLQWLEGRGMLRTEWPDLAPEARFTVQVYANAGPSDRPEVVGVNGPLLAKDDLLSRFYAALWRKVGDNTTEPEPGFYLVESDRDHQRSSFVAFETYDQRAARLAREKS